MICQDTRSNGAKPIYRGKIMNTDDPSLNALIAPRYLLGTFPTTDTTIKFLTNLITDSKNLLFLSKKGGSYEELDMGKFCGVDVMDDSSIAVQVNLDSSDQFLEIALQENNFTTIRAILNRRGYKIPLNEPNNLVLPQELSTKNSDVLKDVEIQTHPEKYGILETSPETSECEPSEERLAIQESFAEELNDNLHFRLERLIRRRDAVMLRMWLRLFGHDILPNQPGEEEDLLDEFRFQGNLRESMPEPSNNS